MEAASAVVKVVVVGAAVAVVVVDGDEQWLGTDGDGVAGGEDQRRAAVASCRNVPGAPSGGSGNSAQGLYSWLHGGL